MGRPTGNADKLLIAAGKEIACVTGCSGLRVRDVADRAGVNLGMFHYYFKSKKRFTRILLQEMYEDFFTRLINASREGPDAITQLRNSLRVMGLFVRDDRHLVGALIKDILNGDPEVLRFASKNIPRHATVLKELLLKCQEEKSLMRVPLPQMVGMIFAGLNMPTLIGGAMELTKFQLPTDFKMVLSDEAIEQRVDLLLRAFRL
jgi:AcrR family transcriptional regulator